MALGCSSCAPERNGVSGFDEEPRSAVGRPKPVVGRSESERAKFKHRRAAVRGECSLACAGCGEAEVDATSCEGVLERCVRLKW